MEYLITDAGERVAIPDVVVCESNGRELVAQYCAASESGRAAIVARAEAAIAEREAEAKAKAEAKAAQAAAAPASAPLDEHDTE